MATVALKKPKTPGYIYSVLLLGLMLMLGVLALTARQPPPPTIAEFAPQATEQIKDAPSEQSSEFGAGEGEGDCPPGAVCGPGEGGGLTDAGDPIEVPRVRKCVGDPPRQIEDPQSPPCVPYWSGDNGGATAKGVTGDEIRIALPLDNDQDEQTMDRRYHALEAFFNKRFEFYGRKLRFIPFHGLPDQAHDPRPDLQVAHAAHVDESIDAFASLSYADVVGYEYYDELARRGVISAGGYVPFVKEDHFQEFHPYQWSYLPGIDVVGRNLGEWVCSQLAGRNAVNAGGLEQGKPRKFGILVHEYMGLGRPDLATLEASLGACGLRNLVMSGYEFRFPDYQQYSTNAIVKLKDAGVTTVLCVCHVFPLITGDMPAATNQQYFPEWLITSFISNDFDILGQAAPDEQMIHAFGLSWWSKWVATPDLPVTWAVKETDPSFNWNDDIDSHSFAWRRYPTMLLLASGIQMAGPNLTPETFATAMQRTRFPNPETPWYAGRVGFANDHTMVNDAAVIWWGNEQRSNWGGVGAWCYADKGERHSPGNWPKKEPAVFTGSCY